jgi:hypothetical protein
MNDAMEIATVSLSALASVKRRVDGEVLIGKDILELLTGAMYVDPLSIFREYIQNACDAIDQARMLGLDGKDYAPRIDVFLDQSGRSIRIRDNGAGVARSDVVRRLTAIGGSEKRGNHFRGFRGVGRLSGLGYCQELVFRTRGSGDDRISEITWNGRKLRDLLRQTDYHGQLADAVREIAEVSTVPDASFPRHFFEVELRKVARLKNDILLNEHEVRTYLSQVAPVPFHPEFVLADEIVALLSKHGVSGAYEIHINDNKGQVYRPFRNTFSIKETLKDRFEEVIPITLLAMDGEVGAIGWCVHHSYHGAIPRSESIAGFRLRAGNIQIGSSDILAWLFPEPRFNSWCVGELHVLGEKVLPNGRRDDFEASVHFQHLQGQLAPMFRGLAKTCRDRSLLRNRVKRISLILDAANSALELLAGDKPPQFVVRFVLGRLERTFTDVERLLSEGQFHSDEDRLIRVRCKKLRNEFDKLAASRSRKIVVRGVVSAKRAAQENVLELIYELSSNPTEAHQLATRIVERLNSTPK